MSQARFFAKPPFEWWTLHGGDKVGDNHYIFSRSYEEMCDEGEVVSMPGLALAPPSLIQVRVCGSCQSCAQWFARSRRLHPMPHPTTPHSSPPLPFARTLHLAFLFSSCSPRLLDARSCVGRRAYRRGVSQEDAATQIQHTWLRRMDTFAHVEYEVEDEEEDEEVEAESPKTLVGKVTSLARGGAKAMARLPGGGRKDSGASSSTSTSKVSKAPSTGDASTKGVGRSARGSVTPSARLSSSSAELEVNAAVRRVWVGARGFWGARVWERVAVPFVLLPECWPSSCARHGGAAPCCHATAAMCPRGILTRPCAPSVVAGLGTQTHCRPLGVAARRLGE